MTRITRLAIAAAALLMLSAAPALAADPGRPLPVHGTAVGVHDIDLTAHDCQPGALWRFNSAGAGQLSHLGSIEYDLTQCTFMQPDGSFTFGDGTLTFTAANGDTLVVAQVGTSDGVVDPGTMELVGFTGEGTWTVIGGTGRFAHASGQGWLDTVGDIPGGDVLFGLPDGLARFDFGGTIAYRASDRAR